MAYKPRPQPTPQALKLYEALKRKGIKSELEAWDGYKHVDISIYWAKLHIEIDGSQHQHNAKQLMSDSKRSAYSHEDGVYTHRVSNFEIDAHLDVTATTIAKFARARLNELQEEEDDF